MSVYDFKVKTIEGKEISLEKYKGKVLLIVNTASKCGFTPQYEGLEALYKKFNGRDFEILGFPCNQFAEQEPESNKEIKKFCQLNFGVSFQMFEKIDVNGENAHPLYKYLKKEAPFEGIDTNSEKGKFLNNYLKENCPESLKDDSIKWNFTKFLIDKNGNVVKRFETPIEPVDIEKDIEKIL